MMIDFATGQNFSYLYEGVIHVGEEVSYCVAAS